ncbi:MAG: HIT family protein [Chloroflexi bacterium]|nr:MAG: HIT family protein [Chloroflexota bacterium]
MTGCPFCRPQPPEVVLAAGALAYAILDKYPASPGHTLVIPYQHTADYFDLPPAVKQACWELVDRVKAILVDRFQPAGFNIGINVGPVAGQTVPHVHIHLIPRYPGDVPDPTGGVRHVIPGKGNYLRAENGE